MTKPHQPEKPPWQPRIDQPADFHTGVPPRNLPGEVLDPPTLLDDLEEEAAEEASPGSAPTDPTTAVR
jgi:hypothetical protein